jgi:dethiobiotin synthetase
MSGEGATHTVRKPRADRNTTRGIFVTGTDTGVGKTRVAAGLLRSLAGQGSRAIGFKPVAAGIEPGATLPRDVQELRTASNVAAPLVLVNPYAFAPAIAPHVAAAQAGVRIRMDRIVAAYRCLADISDVVIAEGAGGVLVPLDEHHDMLDIAAQLELPVLLVVGVRLGCINHALLSAQAIERRGLRLAGFVANRIDPAMSEPDASIATIASRLSAPLLLDLAWNAGVDVPASAWAAMGLA